MRTLASFAVFASVLALAAPAAASETVIDTPARGSVLAARGRTLAYSAYDVASKSYRLRIKVGMSAPRDLGVPPRSVPFDVSIARGSIPRGGHSDVLLYSRCRQEPSGLVGGLPYLRWTTARDCSLWVAGLGGRERRIVGPPSDAVLPSLSGATLAFARVPRSGRSSIVVRHIGSHAAELRRFPAPTFAGSPVVVPISLAVFAGQVAVIWHADYGDGAVSVLELLHVRSGARERVRRVAGGSLTGVNFSGPTWIADGSLHWTEICAGDPEGCPRRHNYGSRSRTGRVTLAPAPLRISAYTTTARAAWTLRNCPSFDLFPDPMSPECQLVQETPPPLVVRGT